MRLDNYLFEKKMFSSRTKAKQAIERGEIFLNGLKILKASFEVNINDEYKIDRVFVKDFVSLGGFKLQKAIDDFGFSVKGLVCADIGASTGGFTDCLLQNGAKKVYSVDLNDKLLSDKLKDNLSVFPIIKNAKDLTVSDFCDKLDLIVADLSFISINMILPVIYSLIDEGNFALILIKPQFETGEKRRFKNGIIRDEKVKTNACFSVYNKAIECGFVPEKFTTAPLDKDKNTEFLILLKKGKGTIVDFDKLFTKN